MCLLVTHIHASGIGPTTESTIQDEGGEGSHKPRGGSGRCLLGADALPLPCVPSTAPLSAFAPCR